MRNTPAEVSPFLETARGLALTAATKLMELRQTTLIKERKADQSLVTNADHEADRIIRTGLRHAFPGHSILTEESVLDGPADAEFIWVVDPLDGTKAYVRGTSGFSVMIGLLRREEPCAGVVVDPWDGHVYEAVRGGGCFHTWQGKRQAVQVSDRSQWESMPIVTSTGFPAPLEQGIKSRMPCPWVPPVNSVGIKVGLLVRQVADIYINHHAVHYWDTCAPQIILEEAGGTMTFLDGAPLRYTLNEKYHHPAGTLATNAKRHTELMKILEPLLHI